MSVTEQPNSLTRRTILEELKPMYLDEINKLDLSDLGGKLAIENSIEGNMGLKRLSTAITASGRLVVSERGNYCVLVSPTGGSFMVPNTTYKFKIVDEKVNPTYHLYEVVVADEHRRLDELVETNLAGKLDERLSHDFFDAEERMKIRNRFLEIYGQDQ